MVEHTVVTRTVAGSSPALPAISVDLDENTISYKQHVIKVSPQQAEIMQMLASGTPVHTDTLLDGLYGAFGERPDNARKVLHVHINRLRAKLRPVMLDINTAVEYDLRGYVPGGRRIGVYTLVTISRRS